MSITDARLQELVATMQRISQSGYFVEDCRDIVAALTHYEQLRQQRAAEWRSMDSAPKDGTEILAYREDAGVFLVRWTCVANMFSEQEIDAMAKSHANDDESWLFDEAWMFADFVRGDRLDGDLVPTHWVPMPSPPDVAPPLQAEDGAGG